MFNVDLYQSELPQPQKEIVRRLRAFIARRYPELKESLKWHVPTYSAQWEKPAGASRLRGTRQFEFLSRRATS